jgi:hypothetical protein
MSDSTLQPQFRECAIFVLSCEVQTFAKKGDIWELRFDSKKAELIRNRETVVEIRTTGGTPMSITRGRRWTQRDRDRWLQKYGCCLRHMFEVINATAIGESGMVVLFEA